MNLGQQEITSDILIDIGGCRLSFSVIPGNETRIVLEVGGGTDSTFWGPFPLQLAQATGASVVTYDRAGFGNSDLPEKPYDMVEEVDWFMAAMRQLGLDQDLILLGHSYGGWLIRLTASRYPDAVRGLVFIDPFSTEFVDLLGKEHIDQHPYFNFPELNTAELTKNQHGGLRMLSSGVGPKAEILRDTRLPNVPVRIITAGQPWWLSPEENHAWRKAHEQMAASIPGAVLLVAEHSDHLIPEKQPDVIIEATRQVIRLSKQASSIPINEKS
ncbi:MAG: alpha/beta hydrolase [Anaerolineales bacterium]|nr:alpha/beta hydrolase [Anaerolineales bacterium]